MRLHTPLRRLYAYIILDNPGLIKVGETTQGIGVEGIHQRIKQQFGTANSSTEYSLVWWTYSPLYTDRQLHSVSSLALHRVSANREWFECDLQTVMAAYHTLTHGISRPYGYSMRHEQEECCNKIVNHFNNGGERFLMAAKMRFGKIFTTYQAIKAMGYSKVLILTYKPQVAASWSDDLRLHVDFREFSEMHRAKDGAPAFEDISTIVFESFQKLLNKSGKMVGKNKSISWIYDEVWDLIVIDEEHYGTRTENASAVLDKLNFKKKISLSGTPFKAMASGEYAENEIFSWTYPDEQKLKLAGSVPHQNMPTMAFHTFNVHPSVIKEAEASGYNSEDGFRIEKMFAATSNGFMYPSAVDLFLTSMASKQVKGQSWSPYRSEEIDNRLMDHMLWMLPSSVDSVTAMCEMLEKHPNFSNYHIINASGNNTVKIADVKAAIRKNERTITVSCDRFNTGVTVPEWKTVMMLDGGKSPEKYFQSIFRSQTQYTREGEIVNDCLVIDFNPQRTLELIYEYCAITAKGATSTEDSIKEFCEVASILEHGANSIVKRSVGDVMMAMSRVGSYIDRFGSMRNVSSHLADKTLIKAFADLDARSARRIEKLLGSDNGVERGKISKALTRSQQKDKKKALDKLKEKAQTALRRIPTYLFVTKNTEKSCHDIITARQGRLFEEVTGISIRHFEHALELGFFNRSSLDRSIADFGYRESQITLDNFLTQD